MSDDLKNRGEPDRSRISLSEEHEVRYWTKRRFARGARTNRSVRGQFGRRCEARPAEACLVWQETFRSPRNRCGVKAFYMLRLVSTRRTGLGQRVCKPRWKLG